MKKVTEKQFVTYKGAQWKPEGSGKTYHIKILSTTNPISSKAIFKKKKKEFVASQFILQEIRKEVFQVECK